MPLSFFELFMQYFYSLQDNPFLFLETVPIILLQNQKALDTLLCTGGELASC